MVDGNRLTPPRPRILSRETFLNLMMSRDSFTRLDDQANQLRGLQDKSGKWFVIRELDLLGGSSSIDR